MPLLDILFMHLSEFINIKFVPSILKGGESLYKKGASPD